MKILKLIFYFLEKTGKNDICNLSNFYSCGFRSGADHNGGA